VDALIDAGKLKVHVSRTYPLAQARDALRELHRAGYEESWC